MPGLTYLSQERSHGLTPPDQLWRDLVELQINRSDEELPLVLTVLWADGLTQLAHIMDLSRKHVSELIVEAARAHNLTPPLF